MASDQTDYYSVLGVARDATPEEIKRNAVGASEIRSNAVAAGDVAGLFFVGGSSRIPWSPRWPTAASASRR